MQVLDNSGSIDDIPEVPWLLLDTAHNIADQFVLNANAVRMGIVSFNQDATLLSPITDDRATIDAGLDIMPWPKYSTDMGDGLVVARDALNTNPRVGANKAVFLLSDGRQTSDPIVRGCGAHCKTGAAPICNSPCKGAWYCPDLGGAEYAVCMAQSLKDEGITVRPARLERIS